MAAQQMMTSLSSGRKVFFGGAIVVFLGTAIASIGYGVTDVQDARAKPIAELLSADRQVLELLTLEQNFALDLVDYNPVQPLLAALLKNVAAIKAQLPAKQAKGLDDATQALQTLVARSNEFAGRSSGEWRQSGLPEEFNRQGERAGQALARRTQQSTQDIEHTIGALLGSTTHAVTCIHDSQALLKKTLGDSERTVESLGVIVSAVANIHERNQHIAHASQEQRTVAEDINRNVTRIRDITEKNSSTVSTTAVSSQALEDLSNTLRRAAERFQL